MSNDCSDKNGAHQNENTRNENKDSFVRWQAITIAQLGFASNLIFGVSVAALGFGGTLLLNGSLGGGPVWAKSVFLVSLVLISISIGLGIWLVINRLKDFRATKSAARLRMNGEGYDKINQCRDEYKKYGERTWCLFKVQIGIFALGLFLFSLSVGIPAADKMFDQNAMSMSSQCSGRSNQINYYYHR